MSLAASIAAGVERWHADCIVEADLTRTGVGQRRAGMEPQAFARDAEVVDRDGVVVGTLAGIDEESEPASIVLTHARDGRHVRIPLTQVDRDASTARRVVVEVPGDALLASDTGGASGVDTGPTSDAEVAADSRFTVPLAAEALVAGTREVEKGRVVIHKRVETAPVVKAVEVGHDEVDIERVPIGQDIEEAPAIRHEGDTMIVPVIEEVLVVEKRLRLIEEIRITSRRVTEEREIREDLRREVVEISGEDVGEPPQAP
jgi:uncharacterized protein (TIGR02271 family)